MTLKISVESSIFKKKTLRKVTVIISNVSKIGHGKFFFNLTKIKLREGAGMMAHATISVLNNCELKASLIYKARPCLKKPKNSKNNNQEC
jgi:hypothetical protein